LKKLIRLCQSFELSVIVMYKNPLCEFTVTFGATKVFLLAHTGALQVRLLLLLLLVQRFNAVLLHDSLPAADCMD